MCRGLNGFDSSPDLLFTNLSSRFLDSVLRDLVKIGYYGHLHVQQLFLLSGKIRFICLFFRFLLAVKKKKREERGRRRRKKQ